ncbi:MAG: orotidine-5'-phosphate decarboxylase [Actinomycetota bacterium]
MKDRLAIVLDCDDLVVAQRIARQVQPHVGVAKVGLELYSAVGPDAVGSLAAMGFKVFVDLKLHDIPNTVERAARVLGSLGAEYLTLHAFGGVDMLSAGVEGLADGASKADLPPPTALAVTVLTSDDGAPPHILPKRVMAALSAGCGGIVCAAADAAEARTYAPRMEVVVPGIRPEGSDHDDQARAATPAEAIASGADLLVVGRPITRAADPAAAAAAVNAEVAAAVEAASARA